MKGLRQMPYEVTMKFKGRWVVLGIACKKKADAKKIAELAQKTFQEVRINLPNIQPFQVALLTVDKLPEGTEIMMSKGLQRHANEATAGKH